MIPENEVDYDTLYSGDDADEIVVIKMTRRQWWHLDDWRAEFPDRYPKRAAERRKAWLAIDAAQPERGPRQQPRPRCGGFTPFELEDLCDADD